MIRGLLKLTLPDKSYCNEEKILLLCQKRVGGSAQNNSRGSIDLLNSALFFLLFCLCVTEIGMDWGCERDQVCNQLDPLSSIFQILPSGYETTACQMMLH